MSSLSLLSCAEAEGTLADLFQPFVAQNGSFAGG